MLLICLAGVDACIFMRWVANYNDEDQTKEVKIICRSLVCCRLELHQNSTATTLKVKAEFDRRGAQK